MGIFTSGGSSVTTSQIVDGTIVNADINAAAAIALSKLSGLIGNPGTFLWFQQENDGSVDITVDGSTRLLVFARANYDIGNAEVTIQLRQDTVVKDTITVNNGAGGDEEVFSLMYTEVPAADTYTIDIFDATGGGTLTNQRIIVIGLKVA